MQDEFQPVAFAAVVCRCALKGQCEIKGDLLTWNDIILKQDLGGVLIMFGAHFKQQIFKELLKVEMLQHIFSTVAL